MGGMQCTTSRMNVSMEHTNLPSCIGASCNKNEIRRVVHRMLKAMEQQLSSGDDMNCKIEEELLYDLREVVQPAPAPSHSHHLIGGGSISTTITSLGLLLILLLSV